MIDLKALELAIADAVEIVTEETVIIANQNAPRPEGSYSTVHLSPSLKVGFDRITYANDQFQDLGETIEGHRELKASINFYRDNAFINASSFIARLQSNTLIAFFKSKGMGYAGVSEIRDISEVNKNYWEERAQFDLTFYALSNFTETVTAIEEANVDGTAESGNNVENFNINIT